MLLIHCHSCHELLGYWPRIKKPFENVTVHKDASALSLSLSSFIRFFSLRGERAEQVAMRPISNEQTAQKRQRKLYSNLSSE